MKLATSTGVRHHPKVILLGSHGVGKTTFGWESPDSVFITTEDGASEIPVPKITLDGNTMACNWTDFHSMLEMALEADHDYRTLVIDTLNGATGLLARHVCNTQYGGRWAAEKGQRSYLAYQEGPKSTAEESKHLLNMLDSICHKREMNILLLCHAGVQNIRNPRLGDYHRFAGDIPIPIWNVFAQWADIIAFADYDMAVLPSGDRRPGVPRGEKTRVLRCGGSVAEDTKCRAGFEVPEVSEFEATMFWPAIGTDTSVISEVKEHWDMLTAEQQKATMAYLGAKKIEDASVRKLRTIAERMRVLRSRMPQEEEEKPDAK